MLRWVFCAAVFPIGMATASPAGAAEVFVAGMRPHERPAGAPVMRASNRDRSAARQFRGVDLPYPQSLRFAMSHGGWFTPFTEPGMTGRYDLRAYHQSQTRAQPGANGGG